MYKQKQSTNDMRERKHSQRLIERAKQDTEKRREITQWKERRSNTRRMRENNLNKTGNHKHTESKCAHSYRREDNHREYDN